MTVAAQAKDAMNQQCNVLIVKAWYVILSRNSNIGLCASFLDSMKGYNSWVSIRFVVNDINVSWLLAETMLDGSLSKQLKTIVASCVLMVTVWSCN